MRQICYKMTGYFHLLYHVQNNLVFFTYSIMYTINSIAYICLAMSSLSQAEKCFHMLIHMLSRAWHTVHPHANMAGEKSGTPNRANESGLWLFQMRRKLLTHIIFIILSRGLGSKTIFSSNPVIFTTNRRWFIGSQGKNTANKSHWLQLLVRRRPIFTPQVMYEEVVENHFSLTQMKSFAHKWAAQYKFVTCFRCQWVRPLDLRLGRQPCLMMTPKQLQLQQMTNWNS